MKIDTRAFFGWPISPAPTAPCDRGLVVHFDGANQDLAGKSHDACRDYWRRTRAFHMGPERGWLDIGYSYGVCPHGIVLEGRGFRRVQAAQPGGNSTWTSVTFCSGPAEEPTPAQLDTFHLLRAELMGRGLATEIRGHRDFISTDCPGNRLYAMVRDGSITRSLAATAPTAPQEVPLRTLVDLGALAPQTIPAGGRGSLSFEKEYADPDGVHTDAGKDGVRYPSIFPKGGRVPYVVRLALELSAPPSGPVTAVWAEYGRNADTLQGDHSPHVLAETAKQVVTWVEMCDDKRKFRADLINGSGADVVVERAFLLVAH